jgi:ABC-type Na+ efflux pump permease subunit
MTHPPASFGSARSPLSNVVHGALVRLVLSVVVPVAWVSLTLVYVAFFAPTFSVFQDIVLVVISILALVGALTVMWVSFGLRMYHDWVD